MVNCMVEPILAQARGPLPWWDNGRLWVWGLSRDGVFAYDPDDATKDYEWRAWVAGMDGHRVMARDVEVTMAALAYCAAPPTEEAAAFKGCGTLIDENGVHYNHDGDTTLRFWLV